MQWIKRNLLLVIGIVMYVVLGMYAKSVSRGADVIREGRGETAWPEDLPWSVRSA